MTPFDGGALLAMLLAFYPVVSAAALARARSERPEYFAGGRLFGSKGDKLELPDGRVFDLIFASGGPASGQRWQVIEPGPAGAGDPFALEEGPLVPLDDAIRFNGSGAYEFEGLAAAAYGELDTLDRAAELHAQTMASASSPAGLDDALAAAADDGEGGLNDGQRELDDVRADELLQRDAEAHSQIDGPQGEWDDQQIASLPDLPDDQNPWIGYTSQEHPPDPGPGPQPFDT